MPILSIHSATGETLRSFPSLAEEVVQQRVALASQTARDQLAVPLEHRILCLRKLATLLIDEGEEMAATVARETGKPIRYARIEVAHCVAACRHYADHAARLLAPELLVAASGQAHLQWSPIGVVLAVLPWNAPIWHGFHFAILSLLAGNTVLVKHAASVPQCALLLAVMVRRAGFSPGSFTALLMDDRLVETVLNDDRVAALMVAGSQTAGRALAAQAGWLLKPSSLHLDGSDAFVVMPSADLDLAAAAAARALASGGTACRRIVLHDAIYDEFTGRLVIILETLRIGDPLKEETELGPLGTAEAVSELTALVDRAVAAGGRIVTGGSRMVGRGNFFEPTVLSHVPLSHAIAGHSIAGPLAIMFRAADAEDAIRIVNGAHHVREAAVWTRQPGEQQRFTAGIAAGAVSLNLLSEDEQGLSLTGLRHPHGGRDPGVTGLRGFLHGKTIRVG